MLNAVTDIDKPAFVIRLDEPELLQANAAARHLWGLTAETELPLAIDADMPALRDILTVSVRTAPHDTASPTEFHDQLVFWTHRGAQRFASRYHLSNDSSEVTVIVDSPNACAPPGTDTQPTGDAAATQVQPGPAPATTLDLRTMAHELRTPIGAVIALADMIDHEPFGSLGDPRYREYARDIRDSAHLALNIVAAALERDDGDDAILLGGIREIDLEALLLKARRAMRLNALSAGLAIDIETLPDTPLLLANPPGLNQILLNLIANAIKFTPPGGHITLGAASTPTGGLEIFVTDTGIGMSEYETSILVDPSKAAADRQASQPGQAPTSREPAPPARAANTPAPEPGEQPSASGAAHVTSGPPGHRGIGFTLVRRLATAMSATLTVSSERGVGTRVAISFPASYLIPKPSSRDDA